MRAAYERLLASPGTNVYQTVFFADGTKFQYPPSSLLIFLILDALGLPHSREAMGMINYGFIALQVAAVLLIVIVAVQRLGQTAMSPRAAVAAGLLAGVACLTFYPVLRAYTLGQLQVWINACFTVAVLLWLLRAPAASGALVGLICLMKPQFSLYLIWAALRRQWRFVGGWSAVMLTGTAISILVFGINSYFGYLEVLQFLSRHGESFVANQSVNGLLNRLIGNGEVARFSPDAFPPFNVLVYAGTFVTSAALIAGALAFRFRASTVTVVDFLIAGLSFTIASPIAWEHHYGILPACIMILVLLAAASLEGRTRWLVLGLLAGAYVVSANLFAFLAWALPPGLPSLLQSGLFYAALAMLVLLYTLRDRSPWPGLRTAWPSRTAPER
jgi:hypothetical protein